MHELGITESLLSTALEYASKAQAMRIKALNLVLGEQSSVAEDSVRFYFEYLSPGTMAEGATLAFQKVPGAKFYLESIEVE
jgi:hydrogenase nickel incorporation protein HypA/HybF